jgi:membrane protease subunit HflC
MNPRRTLILAAAAVGLIFLFSLTLFVVAEGEAAVVTTFGRPSRTVTEPGFHLRWPAPVQVVHRFDLRLQALESPLEQVQTRDGESLIITAFLGWKVADPLRHLTQNRGSAEQAGRNLGQLLSTAKLAVIGRHALADLLNPDPAQVQLDRIEAEILAQVAPQALTLYGLDVTLAGLRKISLPEATTETVAARIRAERESLAEKFRAEGDAEAVRILARAESERDQLVAEAQGRARRIQAEGDAEAAGYYEVFRQNPELAVFLRKLEAFERGLSDQTTLILTDETPPWDLLRQESGGKDKVPAKP